MQEHRMSTSPTPKYGAPDGMSLAQWMQTRIATRATRSYDWNALKFQADFDPKYRRAQMRYVGTGATGVANDKNSIRAEHFTFSTMILPAGAEGPLHLHEDAEEVFFVLRGRVRLIAELNGESWSMEVGERDLVSWPVGVYRGVINITDEEALICVIVGSTQPETPTYPASHPLSKVRRAPVAAA
jgi:quercetin dioxygenase-like cupin family protein